MKVFKWIYCICYVLLIGGIVFAGKIAIDYVDAVLIEYEEAQPERVVSEVVEQLPAFAKDDKLDELITFPVITQSEYDIPISDFAEYKEMIANTYDLSYKIRTGTFSETGQQYYICSAGEPIAILELESISEEKKLGILKVMNWVVKDISPIMKLETYEYTINVPEGSSLTVNDKVLDTSIAENGVITLDKLYSEPSIRMWDKYGCEIEYDIVDNIVTPIIHTYSFRTPNSYIVKVGDIVAEGEQDGSITAYKISTAYESLTISDTHGNSMTYDGTQKINSFSCEIIIPTSYELLINDSPADSFLVSTEDNPTYKYASEYVEMPRLNNYYLPEFLEKPGIVIKDNLGDKADYNIQRGRIEFTEQRCEYESPAIFVETGLDPLKLAKLWSYFMTDDLGGSDNGFSVIKPYLIKDSYMYDVAKKWSTGVDITLTSAHKTEKNYFEEERVGSYKSYGNNVYSFDVHMVKYMYLHASAKWVDDIMNSRFYIMLDEDGNWKILDIQEIIAVG